DDFGVWGLGPLLCERLFGAFNPGTRRAHGDILAGSPGFEPEDISDALQSAHILVQTHERRPSRHRSR
ncbi:MAG TPA: hypothetical protein VEJ84_09195, partial [Acidimicrobiales bacterium]|nr:hypothetical protein [Acidimicrobiales bacterium]